MLTKRIKNNTVSTVTWLGQEIAAGAYYQIQVDEEKKWMEDSQLETDINSGDAVVNDGSTDLSATDGLVWLRAVNPTCVETQFFDLNTTSGNPPYKEGRFFYDNVEKAYAQYNDVSSITHQIGQEFLVRVYNNSGAQIDDGKPVYVSGTETTENRATIALAQADLRATSKVIGITTHGIANNSFGYITTAGLVNNLDTSSYASGETLYLDEVTAGGFRITETTEPGISVVHCGYVIRSHATLGRILVALGSPRAIPSSTGSTTYEIDSTDFQTTSSGSYVSMPGTKIITPDSGSYLALFSGQIKSTASNGLAYYQMYAGGVGVATTIRHMEGSDEIPCSVHSVVTVDGTEDIEMYWKKSGNGNNEVRERTLTLVKVS